MLVLCLHTNKDIYIAQNSLIKRDRGVLCCDGHGKLADAAETFRTQRIASETGPLRLTAYFFKPTIQLCQIFTRFNFCQIYEINENKLNRRVSGRNDVEVGKISLANSVQTFKSVGIQAL